MILFKTLYEIFYNKTHYQYQILLIILISTLLNFKMLTKTLKINGAITIKIMLFYVVYAISAIRPEVKNNIIT